MLITVVQCISVFIRYNGGKPGSYSTMPPAFMKMRCEMIYWVRDHIQKVAYLRSSCLVLSASSRLYWSDPRQLDRIGLMRLRMVGHAYQPLTFMVGHCNKTCWIWPMTARNFDLCSNQPPPTCSKWAWAAPPTPTDPGVPPSSYRGPRFRPRGRRAGRGRRGGRGDTGAHVSLTLKHFEILNSLQNISYADHQEQSDYKL